MGILDSENICPANILLKHGFEYTERNVTGQLTNCYERCLKLSSDFYGYVAVSTVTREVFIYVEWACGGEIASYETTLTSNWYNEKEFFEELDAYATTMLEEYSDKEEDNFE